MAANVSDRKGAVFLDRDGTIIEDTHFCCRVEDVRILPSVAEAIKLLEEHGFRVAIVSNQSGVGRGYFTEVEVQEVNGHIVRKLQQQGAVINAVYYCPHHPEDDCDCRKPRPGMLLQAIAELSVSAAASFMVGDKASDIAAGRAAGCHTVLIAPAEPQDNPGETAPDYIAGNLLQAARWITGEASAPAAG